MYYIMQIPTCFILIPTKHAHKDLPDFIISVNSSIKYSENISKCIEIQLNFSCCNQHSHKLLPKYKQVCRHKKSCLSI